MNNTVENLSKIRLLLDIDGIGPGKLFSLISKFKSLDHLLEADYRELLYVEGISDTLARKIINSKKNYPETESSIIRELENLKKIGGKWLTFWSKDYPQNLRHIFAPPIVLYYMGTLEERDTKSLSIVGTRTPTMYGKKYADKLSREIASNSITVVSGMARGIDTIAHNGALSMNGRTIAILGSGLDVIYPYENKNLYDRICENGAVISEYPLKTKPDAQNFPKRNRIISGFSLGTLVIESKITGGAIQTASLALEQNKEVFAVPGNLGMPQSEGTNKLIQKGEAKLILNSEDIFVELNMKVQSKLGKNISKPAADLNLFEQNVFNKLTDEPKHIDIISSEANMSASECSVHLLSLEFRDLIKQLPGKNFVKN